MVVESGNIPKLAEFVRESTFGEAPTDPSFVRFADDVSNESSSHDFGVEAQRPNDSAYPTEHHPGPEAHTGSVEYFMQQWLIDGSSNALDASYDGLFRDSDGLLPNSHTCLFRSERSSGGNDGGGIWTIEVWKGAKIGTASLDLAADTGLPIPVSLDYEVREKRIYDLHQPSSSTSLVVKSSDSGDTSQTVTVENADASTSETYSLNGTNLVTAATTYSEIGQIEIDSRPTGDITIAINDGDQTTPTEGSTVMTIKGSASRAEGYVGDLGIPLIGSGSHGTALGDTTEQRFLGDNVERPSSTAIADKWGDATFEVSNNLSRQNDGNQDQFHDIQEGQADPEFSIEIWGETVPRDYIEDIIDSVADDLVWTADGGSVTLKNAHIADSITREIAAGDERLTIEPAFSGTDVTVS